MREKRFFGTSFNLSSPIKVYRFGWLFLAGTSAIYLFFIAVRTGLGLNFEMATQPIQNRAASIQGTKSGMIEPQNNRRQIYTGHQIQQGHSEQQQHNLQQQNAQRTAALIQRSRNFQRPAHIQQQQYNNTHQTISMHKANLLVTPSTRSQNHLAVQRNATPQQKTQLKNNAQRPQRPRIRTVKIRRDQQPVPVRQGNFIGNAGYAQGFVQDLQFHSDTPAKVRPSPPGKAIKAQYGIKLAKARNVSEIRQQWARLNTRHFKLLRRLAPLIYKENTGDQFPIKLIVGPFNTPEKAIKFCATLKTTYDCNLKRYSGTPL